LRGKIDKFSLDALVNMLGHAGVERLARRCYLSSHRHGKINNKNHARAMERLPPQLDSRAASRSANGRTLLSVTRG